MPMYYYVDYWYIVLILPALLIGLFAQISVKTTFNKYSKKMSRKGLTASEAARRILNDNGLSHIRVERVGGSLTDHFDPRSNVIRLSDSVYDSASIAAIGVAAHDAGHAVQHATNYLPIKMRNSIVPVANFGSRIAPILILFGFILSFEPLIWVGIILYSAMALFQLVTLPVELNASRRATVTIASMGILEKDEVGGAKKVLTAAALTYVAALITTLAYLLRFILLARGRNRE